MIVSDKYKFIFLGCPKTGSTSIKVALLGNGEKMFYPTRFGAAQDHIKAVEFRKAIDPGKWNSYFKFSFVRNPWDRRVSLFFHHLGKEAREYKDTKNHFFRRYIVNRIPWFGYHYAYENTNKQIVDFIGRFENLQEEFDKICDTVGMKRIPLTKQRFQKGKNVYHYREYYKYRNGSYNEELIGLVKNDSAVDINLFNYKFER